MQEGGHNIPLDVIRRRYVNGIKNLFEIYLPIADEVLIFDNSDGNSVLIAEKLLNSNVTILDEDKFNKLKNYHERK